jgi:hypothetical protein
MFTVSSWQVIFEAEVSGGRSGYIAIDDIQVLSYPCGRLWLRIVFFCVLSTLVLYWQWLLIVFHLVIAVSLLLLFLVFSLVWQYPWNLSRIFDSNIFQTYNWLVNILKESLKLFSYCEQSIYAKARLCRTYCIFWVLFKYQGK